MAFSLFGSRRKRPDDFLPPGWQFYSRPTNLEPPGTVFRIDHEGRRFIVANLRPTIARGGEPGASKVERMETKAGFVARLLGLQPLGAHAGGGTARAFRFQIVDPVRESTSDEEMDKVLGPWLESMAFRKQNRYFVIRESRSASAMTFLLSDEEVGAIGGKLAIVAAAEGGLTLAARSTETSEITQAFPERLGVMFLAEEIAPVVAALAGGEAALGRVAVSAVLDWVEAEYAVVRVFFATDRAMTASPNPGEKFGAGRSELSYGACEVSIPRDHRMGELEAPSILKLEFSEDPAKHVVVLAAIIRPREAFFADLAERVRRSGAASAFLFVHGYNVTFEDAARRTAQIAYDLGFEGAPVFYSWPSEGRVAAYTVDEANIEWAQANLQGFLQDFFERSDARNLYLIAHSMGNRALTRATAHLLAERPELGQRLREIILTAPDIDAEVFKRDIAPALTAAGRPVTLYASSRDLALVASKKVHGYPRAGESAPSPIVLRGIETIDATAVDTSLVGHSYFAESRSVLSDIFYLVRDGHRAERRFGLRTAQVQDGRYWIFKR